jgi:formate dehydrogenase iron-sulfur subunit
MLGRRGMIGAIGAIGAKLCLGRLESAEARESRESGQPYGCLIDLTRCVGCRKCYYLKLLHIPRAICSG